MERAETRTLRARPTIRGPRRIAIAIVATIAVYAGLVFAVGYHADHAIAQLRIGDSERQVLDAFYRTPEREISTDASTSARYTDKRCVTPCVQRLWWENPLLPGIEAWSVSLDRDGRVIQTYKWTSP